MSDYVHAKIENGSIVIQIPQEYLKKVAVDAAFEGITGYEDVKVVDYTRLLRDIKMELNREAEDGTTLVHLTLDKAIRNAFDNGSEAFED